MSVSLIQLSRKEYSPVDRDYILSKVQKIEWNAIPPTLKDFWLEWRDQNN